MLTALERSETAAISAATLVEASIVAGSRHDPVRSARFDALVDALDLEVVAVDATQAQIARRAHRDYGRGSGHPARLNFGDCFAYALATARRAPLPTWATTSPAPTSLPRSRAAEGAAARGSPERGARG
ncbi:hypothetical protein GCM10022240_00780 [Microbacterium kribbense]|uniref:PIN domain-containing protein n=1 Tax=Microbacterium kribbense TaxID=433645 RepID=A0ABP7G1M3_9MICO